MDRIAKLLSGRRSAWAMLAIAVTIMGCAFAALAGTSSGSMPARALPDGAESAKVADIQRQLSETDATAAIVVYTSPTALSPADRSAIDAAAKGLAALSIAPPAVRPDVSKDGTTAIVTVPLAKAGVEDDPAAAATRVRNAASAGVSPAVTVQLTGPLGFEVDTAAAFAGADLRLLLITAGVVALLLLITYRSPVLWLVPLAVIAVADGLARFVIVAIGEAIAMPVDASVSGIASVLVFGAGTNYALLLVARYREELRRHEDRHEAMALAWRRTAPAILASGGTVALALLSLEFASLDSNKLLGWACACGIVIAMAGALLVLPPALVVCGRGLFWPFAPAFNPGAVQAQRPGAWLRLAQWVRRRPVPILIVAALGLGALSLGLTSFNQGLSRTDQLLGSPESVTAQGVIDAKFSAGSSASATLIAPAASAAKAAAAAGEVAGVVTVTPAAANGTWASFTLALAGDPASAANRGTVSALRQAMTREAPGALVGGTEGESADMLTAAQHDQALIMPIILAVVVLMLIVLLRSLLAPLLLLVTVLASFAAALGAGTWFFTHVAGYAGLDNSVPLFAFLFLVALGVDYNIFLTTRAREERARLGAREAMVRALASTGGVITSAGILLAAVFAVLGVLPVVALAQIGTIVCIGVLLDTLVVRTLVVPSLAFLTGENFWWPTRRGARELAAGSAADGGQPGTAATPGAVNPRIGSDA